MVQKLPPLPPSVSEKPEAQRWFTQVQQILNTAVQGTNGYYTVAPTTGSTVVAPSNVSSVILHPAVTLATLTVQLPGTVPDGTILRVVSSTVITALTITATGGATVLGAPASLAANVGPSFQFMAVNAANGIATPTWQRLQ